MLSKSFFTVAKIVKFNIFDAKFRVDRKTDGRNADGTQGSVI